MTLTEFLMARIAADEKATERFLDDYVPEGAWGLTRVLAQCKANRRIVDLHAHNARWDDTNIGNWARATLMLLALPYADHPDYNESWRP